MNDGYKEVYFDQYCKTCRYEKRSEDKDPCFDCLNEPVNVYSHKPVNYEEKKKWQTNKEWEIVINVGHAEFSFYSRDGYLTLETAHMSARKINCTINWRKGEQDDRKRKNNSIGLYRIFDVRFWQSTSIYWTKARTAGIYSRTLFF